MEKENAQDRCEICLFFQPDDKFKHILKTTQAKNPGGSSEQAARMMGYDPGSSSEMGSCSRHDKRMKESDWCEDYSHDSSKNY